MNTRHNIFLAALVVLAGSTLLATAGAGGGAAGAARGPAPVTLIHPSTAETAPNAEGFLQRWLILEPFSVAGVTQNAVQAAVKKEYFPDQFNVLPHDGDKVTSTNGELIWHAVDTINYNVNLYHFAYALNKSSANALFWVVTVVNCPEEMRDVRLAIGSNDASIWWVNGQEVIGIYGDRQTVVDDGVSKKLTLKKGHNVIRAAVHNQGGATDFCARILDADDKPVKGLTITLPE